MSGHKLPNDFLPLVEALVDDTIDAAGFARLDTILSDDANARRLYRRYMNLHAALPALVGNAPQLALKLSDQPGDQITDAGPMPDSEFIRLLLEVEASGHSVDLVDATELFAQRKRAGRRSLFASPLVMIASGIAAVLVLAITLMVVLTPGPTPTQPTADQSAPFKPADPFDRRNAVATLTDQHNATWAEGALAPGSRFNPGTRLTLTAGFAEITTNDGAITILEAPATIELLDNKNAIRLHTGKLVGICETDFSKGFLVRTPHMDVTDLGTEFGVEVNDNDQATQVHVITGEVRVSTNRGGADPITLLANQAMKASAGGIETIAYEPARFERDVKLAQLRPRFEGGEANWLGRPPSDLRIDRQTSLALQVYLEHASLRLDQPLSIDSDEQTPWPPEQLASRQIAAGQTVDVYLLHLDTPDGQSVIGRQYTLHFDRPILGIIGAHSTLRATDHDLGVKGVQYPVAEEGIKERFAVGLGLDYPTGSGPVDDCEIVNDGRTLKLRLTTGENIDQLRVLVQAAEH